jgi:hypothetical protein
VGAVAGVGGATLFFSVVDITKLTQGILLTFEVTPRIMGIASTVGAGLGIVASIAPCVSVARATVVEGLKTLD